MAVTYEQAPCVHVAGVVQGRAPFYEGCAHLQHPIVTAPQGQLRLHPRLRRVQLCALVALRAERALPSHAANKLRYSALIQGNIREVMFGGQSEM